MTINPYYDGGPYHIEASPLICSAMDWFLYDRDLDHEKVNPFQANVPILRPLKKNCYYCPEMGKSFDLL